MAMRLAVCACVIVTLKANEDAVSLLQSRAEKQFAAFAPAIFAPAVAESATASSSHAVRNAPAIDSTVTINEKGYQAVAALKSPSAMAAFIRRLASSRDLHISDDGGLNGFAQYYAGGHDTRFERLAMELDSIARFQSNGWVNMGAGAAAPLSEDGYSKLVANGTSVQMNAFVRRIARAHGLYVTDDGGLAGFANFYSSLNGQHPKWSLKHMVKEMDEISLMDTGGWLHKGRQPISPFTVSLNQVGYKKLLDLGAADTANMAIFIRRIVEKTGKRVVNDASLKGFAKFYSGEISKWSFDHLVKEIEDISQLEDGWVKHGVEDTTALTASLDQTGYREMLRKRSTPAMAVFIRRAGESRGYEVASEGGLYGFAKFYSGESGSWGYDHLVKELDGIAKLPTGWLQPLGLE